MKTYVGYRGATGAAVQVLDGTGGRPLDPRYSLALRNHSPTGFEWGYGGSGPAQLALAILLDAAGQETALSLYQQFKFQVVGRMPKEWELTSGEVEMWVADPARACRHFAAKWDGKETEERV